MILVDLNQVMISNLMVQIGGQKDIELDEDLFRHMILNSVRSFRTKFGNKYGELVICCDDRNFWRRQRYPYYKASRKKYRDQSSIDWSSVFNILNKVRDEIKEYFPYKVIQVDTAEADDIIGTLAHYININSDSKTLILILSGDKDFIQLHKFKKVTQYDPVQKRWVKHNDPHKYLIEHIAKGDRGDGVPNMLSKDDVFVTGERQKPMRTKYLDTLKGNVDEIENIFENDDLKRGWLRNRMLIDLKFIPEDIQKKVLDQYNIPAKGRGKLFNYFVKHKLKHLMKDISEF
jgi:5'-3' exonuclease